MPLMVDTAFSIGLMTRVSISFGLAPGYTTETDTKGNSVFGMSATGRLK